MKILVFSLCFLLFTNVAFAGSDSIPQKPSKHQLGLNVGSATGLGLSYRYTPVASKLMHQVTFLPVFVDDMSFVDLSYSLFYRLRERKYADFNLYCGTHGILVADNTHLEVNNITGGGFGFNFKLSSYFTCNLNGGFALYSIANGSIRTNSLLPAGELGLFYKL
ncbi:MAG: hypothetical protein NT150_00825 [Bacteroidetes bacterium]|nr:hypothetical protein [Bacteroidota bacterium]